MERLTASCSSHLAGHRLLGAVKPSRASWTAPVPCIAEHRVTNLRQVDSDLMRPAGLERQLDPVGDQVTLYHAPLGERGTTLMGTGRHPLTIPVRTTDRGIENALFAA
jgi:hypothetical protein